ncbi:hypothetical protein PN467_11625 [Microcystis aeruginosa CS-563/04]|nr:hypothetical protein [Microcystis aeruginosa]MDB9421145.1 hypothetical protein [Microcystis aeruginosa CS-563/04]NCR08561.1 hypothetical protein [Microcystis aeruginosa LG13-11]
MTLNQLNIFPVFRSLVVNFRRLGGLILLIVFVEDALKAIVLEISQHL